MVQDEGLRGDETFHLVGIGGVGMSAIARVLLERGHPVSGSDLRDSPTLRSLAARGARVYLGHSPEHVPAEGIVVVTSAAPPDNPEVLEARRRGLPVWSRAEMLRRLCAGRRCLAVSGIHGKTTTTALLAFLLRAAGKDPSFIIGGEVPELGGNGHAGSGPHLVLEADEYDRTFLALRPDVAVVTNVEWEHVDCYPDPRSIYEAFAEFLARVPGDGAIFLCQDDAGAREVGAGLPYPRPSARIFTYGLAPEADWRADEVALGRVETTFTLLHAGRRLGRFRLRIPGEHNVRNALAALAVALGEGVSLETAGEVLADFAGVQRRFQEVGTAGGVTVVDDYAHHPSEVRATLAAARQRFPERRLAVVFQPHTYSRTRAFARDLAAALSPADLVLVTGIYAARESDPGDVSGREIVALLPSPAGYAATLEEALGWLAERLRPGDVLLTLGAGDITTLGPRLLSRLLGKEEADGTL
ncbi:MAG: UDP-N-acetylmuramate--L-alanine ligase [Chloroflexia bacterium]